MEKPSKAVPVLGNKEQGRRLSPGNCTERHLLLPRMLKISRVSVLQRSCWAEIGGEAQLCPWEICSASAGILSPRHWSSLLTWVHKRVILLPTRRGTAGLRGVGVRSAQRKDAVASSAVLSKTAFPRHGSQPLPVLLALGRDPAQSRGWLSPATLGQSITLSSQGPGLGWEHRSGLVP